MAPGNEHGFTYVTLLFAIAVVGIGLAQIGPRFSDQALRDREADLLRVGNETIRAVRSYHLSTAGPVKILPRDWNDLLEDRRSVQIRRHLRRIPRDPITNEADWEILRDNAGAMIGIRSRSTERPFRVSGVEIDGHAVPAASSYRDWNFVYEPTPLQEKK